MLTDNFSNEANPQTGLWTYKEAAEYLSLSQITLRRWVMNQSIPYLKIGLKAVRFSKKEIDAWLESQKVRAAGGGK